MLLLLFIFNVVYEVMIVVSTVAMAERRRVLSPVISALTEPVRLLSLLFVVESTSKILAVGVVMVACTIGNYLAIALMDWIDKRKKRKRLEKAINSNIPETWYS